MTASRGKGEALFNEFWRLFHSQIERMGRFSPDDPAKDDVLQCFCVKVWACAETGEPEEFFRTIQDSCDRKALQNKRYLLRVLRSCVVDQQRQEGGRARPYRELINAVAEIVGGSADPERVVKTCWKHLGSGVDDAVGALVSEFSLPVKVAREVVAMVSDWFDRSHRAWVPVKDGPIPSSRRTPEEEVQQAEERSLTRSAVEKTIELVDRVVNGNKRCWEATATIGEGTTVCYDKVCRDVASSRPCPRGATARGVQCSAGGLVPTSFHLDLLHEAQENGVPRVSEVHRRHPDVRSPFYEWERLLLCVRRMWNCLADPSRCTGRSGPGHPRGR